MACWCALFSTTPRGMLGLTHCSKGTVQHVGIVAASSPLGVIGLAFVALHVSCPQGSVQGLGRANTTQLAA